MFCFSHVLLCITVCLFLFLFIFFTGSTIRAGDIEWLLNLPTTGPLPHTPVEFFIMELKLREKKGGGEKGSMYMQS